MTGQQQTRRKQRAADVLGVFLGILAGMFADSDDLLPRVIVAMVVGVAVSLLLRLVLRVPVWRTEPDDKPPNLPPYGEPPVG
jgi:hypothetical protein